MFNSRGPVFGFPLEAVFHVYDKRVFLFFEQQLHKIVEEYINRPRYIDGSRSAIKTPAEFINSHGRQLLNDVPKTIDNQVSLLSWILQQIALSHDKRTWAAFDLHPEFRYTLYRSKIPNLRLAVMQRQPESAVAAAMYWRTWPQPPSDRHTRFRNILGLLALSQQVSRNLSRTNPNDVITMSLDLLCEKNDQELRNAANFFQSDKIDFYSNFDFTPHFRFEKSRGFYTPGGTWEHLLTKSELETIRSTTLGNHTGIYLKSIIAVGWRRPIAARKLSEFYLYPKQSLIRQLNAVKQCWTDTRHGLRLKRQATFPSTNSLSQHFFVVSGAHGVGKSTSLGIALNILQEEGIPATGFHHRLDKMRSNPERIRPYNSKGVLRTCWHLLPSAVRYLLRALIDEYTYATSIFSKLFDISESGQIALADRYIYDRLTDLKIRKRPWYHICAVAIFCRLTPQPAMSFILIDTPKNIYDRKQELEENEINRYQTLLLETTKKNNAFLKVIHIDQRDAHSVAKEIALNIKIFLRCKKPD